MKRAKGYFCNPRGLTLIELLIAISIFVVLMVTIYSSFQTGIFGHRNIEETITSYQAARQVLDRVNLDLRSSFIYSSEDAKFTGNSHQISFLTLVDTFKEDKIVRDFAFVSYNVTDDKLMRLCRKGKDSLRDSSEIQPEEMVSGVEVVFQYAHIPNENAEIEFQDDWGIDSDEEKKVLPAAVKISLIEKDKTQQGFERTIYIPIIKTEK